MLALVTGAGGFCGRYVIDELLEKGYEVRAMIRRRGNNSIPESLVPLQKEIEIIRGDVTNTLDVLWAVHGAGAVFHLASQSFVPDSVLKPSYTMDVNTKGTLNI